MLLHPFLDGDAEKRGTIKKEAFNASTRLRELPVPGSIAAIPVLAYGFDIVPGSVDVVADPVQDHPLWRSYQACSFKPNKEKDAKQRHNASANKEYDTGSHIKARAHEEQDKE